jgi:hypothetical protein
MFLGDWLDADDLGCFIFLETAINLNWGEAQQKCEQIGGYLAEPRTRRYQKSNITGQTHHREAKKTALTLQNTY